MTLEEVKKALQDIIAKLESDEDLTEEQIKELEDQAEKLEEEQKALIAKAEKRNATLDKVKKGIIGRKLEESGEEGKEKRNMEENILSSAEYRSAYLKNLQKKELNEAEERAMTSAANSVGVVIPTITQDLIIEKVEQEAPLLQEIELMHVDGNVTFAVETDKTEASIHAEGATITEDGDVLVPVNLSSYEITKYITVSKTVAKMSIDAFEKWLVKMISKRIARKITKLIIAGTGTNQPTGIEKANTWDETNSVTVAANAALTTANVIALEALLPGAYDANAKYLMSKKTLFTDFKPLQDKSKNDIFVREGNKYYVDGYEVMLDDSVALHDAYLGDFSMYAGNLGSEVTVDTDKKLSSNSYEYLGSANFDGKPALGEAFVKLTKASSN